MRELEEVVNVILMGNQTAKAKQKKSKKSW